MIHLDRRNQQIFDALKRFLFSKRYVKLKIQNILIIRRITYENEKFALCIFGLVIGSINGTWICKHYLSGILDLLITVLLLSITILYQIQILRDEAYTQKKYRKLYVTQWLYGF